MASLIKFAISGGESPKLIPLKALYFIHYMAFSTQTFLPMYFDFREHYTKFQIGILLALPCICTIIAPPAWGAAADILRSQKQIHVFCLISAALLMFSLQFVKSFEFMCIMFFIANFQTQPTWSLLDQVAMEMLDSIGGDYGKQRLYGAIGYGIGGYMSGVITAWIGIQWCFNMVLALSVFSLILLVYFLPSSKHHQESVQFLSSLSYILKQRDVLLLFILVLVIGVMAMVIDNFLFLYLFNLANNNSKLIGIVIAVQTTSELPLFFHANPIIDAMGTPKCIFLGILAYTVRLLVYTFIQNPWMVLPIEVLHGITFGLVWAAFTNYVYNSAPAGTEGTMIGLLAALQKGAGGGVAALLGGWVYQTYGPRVMWASSFIVAVPLAIIIAAMFALFAKSYKSGSKQSPSSDFEAQPLKPRTPSYGSVHHFGSSGHLAELGR